MLMKIILSVCFIPIPLIMLATLMNETKPKKNLILGVTLPKEARQYNTVKALCRQFRILLSAVTAAILLLAVPVFFLKSDSVVFTYYIIWLLLAIVIPAVPYAVYNGKLKSLKLSEGWFGEASGQLLVDTALAEKPKHTLSILWLVPPLLISFIPVVHTVLALHGTDEFLPMLIVYTALAATNLLFLFMYRIIYHQKAEVVDENTALNAALTQIRRYNWAKFWLWSSWLSGLFSLTFWLFRSRGDILIASCLLYGIVLTAVSIRVELKTRKLQQKLTEGSGRTVYADDDDKWLFGMVYYNPADSHAFVNNRIGIGMTMNMAKTSGKLIIVCTLLLLLSLPLIGVFMMKAESTPVRLRAEDGYIIAEHTSVAYKIDIADIASAQLLDTLPTGTRTNGTAMDSVLKGSFSLKGIGSCRLCLDPRSAPFIEIKTNDRIYVLGSSDPKETYDVFVAIPATASSSAHPTTNP